MSLAILGALVFGMYIKAKIIKFFTYNKRLKA